METEFLNRNVIRLDGGTQTRAEINWTVVQEYCDHIRDGGKFKSDPVVFFDGVDYWLADGFHRVHAYQLAGKDIIPVFLRLGTQRDAVLFSVGANENHGLRRNQEDRRRGVLTLLNDDEWKNWSDREIARRCNVSHFLVGTIRKTLTGRNASEKQPDRTFTTKHGTTSTMDTRKIGKKPKSEVEIPCGTCGEIFDSDVWHCPTCNEHWPRSKDACPNCHRPELLTAKPPNESPPDAEPFTLTPQFCCGKCGRISEAEVCPECIRPPEDARTLRLKLFNYRALKEFENLHSDSEKDEAARELFESKEFREHLPAQAVDDPEFTGIPIEEFKRRVLLELDKLSWGERDQAVSELVTYTDEFREHMPPHILATEQTSRDCLRLVRENVQLKSELAHYRHDLHGAELARRAAEEYDPDVDRDYWPEFDVDEVEPPDTTEEVWDAEFYVLGRQHYSAHCYQENGRLKVFEYPEFSGKYWTGEGGGIDECSVVALIPPDKHEGEKTPWKRHISIRKGNETKDGKWIIGASVKVYLPRPQRALLEEIRSYRAIYSENRELEVEIRRLARELTELKAKEETTIAPTATATDGDSCAHVHAHALSLPDSTFQGNQGREGKGESEGMTITKWSELPDECKAVFREKLERGVGSLMENLREATDDELRQILKNHYPFNSGYFGCSEKNGRFEFFGKGTSQKLGFEWKRGEYVETGHAVLKSKDLIVAVREIFNIAPTRKTLSAVPTNFQITDEMREWAATKCPEVNADLETEKFTNFYLSKGERRADWNAAWRNWMLKAVEFAPKKPAPKLTVVKPDEDRYITQPLDDEDAREQLEIAYLNECERIGALAFQEVPDGDRIQRIREMRGRLADQLGKPYTRMAIEAQHDRAVLSIVREIGMGKLSFEDFRSAQTAKVERKSA